MAKNFTEEVLGWALDQDSIQSLINISLERWGLDRSAVLKIIADMIDQDLICLLRSNLYNDDYEFVGIRDLYKDDKLCDSPIWIGSTSKTVCALNELLRNSKNEY